MKSDLRRIFKSPIVISLIIAIVVILLIPPLVSRKIIHVSNSFLVHNRLEAYYEDADSSVSFVSFLKYSRTSMHLESVGKRKNLIRGYTLNDYHKIFTPLKPPRRDDVLIEDVNSDGVQDIFYVDQVGDSAFLVHATVEDPEAKKNILISDHGEINYYFIRFFYFNDGQIYFTFFSKKGRKDYHSAVFSYCMETDKIESVFQLNRVFRGMQLPNYEDHILLYSKERSDVSFYDINVKDKSCDTIPLQGDDFVFLFRNTEIFPYQYYSKNVFVRNANALYILDQNELINYDRIQKKLIAQKKGDEKFSIMYSKDNVVFYTKYTKSRSALFKYDFKTNKTKRIKIKGRPFVKTILYYGDLDDNGKCEIVFVNEKNAHESYCVFEEDRLYPNVCVYPVGRDDLDVKNCIVRDNKVFFQSQKMEQVISYRNNPNFYKHWLWVMLIGVFIVFTGYFVQKMKEMSLYRKQQSQSRILQLQLENVQRRIDPHFIFNSLNNLGAMILEGNSDESYDYLSQVSGVLYKALRNRGILVTVEEELNFCTSVLDTQQMRFKGRFDYDVFVEKEVDTSEMIPSNVLNNLVDNSIKHGFAGISYKGSISIEILKKEKGLLVVVEDNGKGRKVAHIDKDQSKSTGTGLDICYNYVALFNQNRKDNRLSFRIMDLYEGECATGTRCEFYVPNGLEYHKLDSL